MLSPSRNNDQIPQFGILIDMNPSYTTHDVSLTSICVILFDAVVFVGANLVLDRIVALRSSPPPALPTHSIIRSYFPETWLWDLVAMK